MEERGRGAEGKGEEGRERREGGGEGGRGRATYQNIYSIPLYMTPSVGRDFHLVDDKLNRSL